MMASFPRIAPTLLTELPVALRHTGPPSDWAEMVRPGQNIDSFLEAPFFDANGDLWLTDIPYGKAYRLSADLNWHLEHRIDGALTAMRLLPDGRRIGLEYSRGLVELTGTNGFSVITGGLPGQPFRGTSDMCLGPDGAVWFTDSGKTSMADPTGRVYRWQDGALRLVLDTVPWSNGICLSPDGARVYVAATQANQIWRFGAALPAGGRPLTSVFLHLSGGLGPDGLATNDLGWLAVAQAQAGRAYVVTELGDPLAEIRLPKGAWTTAVAFDPADPHRLILLDAQFAAIWVADLTGAAG